MRQPLAITTITLLVMFAATSTAQARPDTATWKTRTITTLRHQIQHRRVMTWHLQDRAGITRTPTAYAEQRTSSVPFLAWIRKLWIRRQQQAARRLARQPQTSSVPSIICRVFGSACSEAERVAYCESRYSIHAVNGQYLGIFQMGSSERATYAKIGYATAYEQIVAAHNYYMVAGWGPWACA